MFSGARLPVPGVVDLALALAERWGDNRRSDSGSS
jgi:hypothetical protein